MVDEKGKKKFPVWILLVSIIVFLIGAWGISKKYIYNSAQNFLIIQ